MIDPIVEISNLNYAYGNRQALDGLSLQVQANEIFGFLGPNGSGKTTLFRILSTLIPAPAGAVKMFGKDVACSTDDIRPRMGVVFQSPSLDKELTAAENLRHHGHLYGLGGADLESRIEMQLEKVGLTDRANDRVKGFSGGMRRRVELAKGLLNRPEILLLDEPSTGLDPSARIELWKSLQEIREAGITILITTHLMDEADRCSGVAILQSGKLIVSDTPTALKERIGGDIITIDATEPDSVEALLKERLGLSVTRDDRFLRIEKPRGHEWVPRIIEAAPHLIVSISVGKPTLEDVFIQLTGNRFDHQLASVMG